MLLDSLNRIRVTQGKFVQVARQNGLLTRAGGSTVRHRTYAETHVLLETSPPPPPPCCLLNEVSYTTTQNHNQREKKEH